MIMAIRQCGIGRGAYSVDTGGCIEEDGHDGGGIANVGEKSCETRAYCGSTGSCSSTTLPPSMNRIKPIKM